MTNAAPRRLARRLRSLSPRAAVLTGGALMVAGQVALAARQPAWIDAIAFPVGCAVWLVGTLWTDSLADGAVLTVAEGTLPVFSFAGALAVVGGGLVWPRLAGVAGIAGLAGVVSYLFQGASSVVHVGLVAAIGFLAWVAPRTRPRKTPGSSETAARSPADGGDG